MKPTEGSPIVLAIPLDHGAQDVLEAAAVLAKQLGAPVLPVHGVGWRARLRTRSELRGTTEDLVLVRSTLDAWVEPLREAGVEVLEPVVESQRPEQLVPAIAARAGAQLTIVGSGRGSTARDWLLGTSAERIVRASAGPVWIARGTSPGAALPVLVPVDLGEETRLSILAGARWARLLGARLRVLHVLPAVEPATESAIDALRVEATKQIELALAHLDGDLVSEVAFAHGPIGASLVSEADDAGLVVIVQPDYEMLLPTTIGSHVERLIRSSRASVVALRDHDAARERAVREERASWVATLIQEAEAALADGDPARAERLLSNAKIAAPASVRIEEALAGAIEAQGRAEEADRHRALARWLRAELG